MSPPRPPGYACSNFSQNAGCASPHDPGAAWDGTSGGGSVAPPSPPSPPSPPVPGFWLNLPLLPPPHPHATVPTSTARYQNCDFMFASSNPAIRFQSAKHLTSAAQCWPEE